MSKANKKIEHAESTLAKQVRVMIVDDHPVVRQGFASLIQAEADMCVCCQSGSASEALAKYAASNPTIALVDLTLEEGSGIELIKDLVARDPSAKIIVVSGHDEGLYAERCLRAGASGYVSKHEAADRIIDAIRTVLEGNFCVSDAVSSKLLRRMSGKIEAAKVNDTATLSDRELEVFELLGRGNSVKEIAEHLYLSPKTIETYRAHLKEKLGIQTSQQLARRAYQWVESGG
jgi:DNA-binding NarL/FixJ family response regulator